MPDPKSNPALVKDCETLLAAKNALAGEADLNWSETISLMTWQGVEVGGHPRMVVVLHLHNRALIGVIPPGLSRLAGLETLDLSHNRLTGTIPPELADLASLRFLRLHVNRLSGSIPVEFGKLKKLETLDIGQNLLTGEIPRELGGLPYFRELYLGVNYLAGTVPAGLAELASFQALDVSNNRLSGCVPSELRSIGANVWPQRFCDDPPPLRLDRPVFDGGVDLGVTYIERLPRYQRYELAYLPRGDCPYPFEEFKGATVCPHQAGIKRWPDPGAAVDLIAHAWNFGDTSSGPFEYEWKVDKKTLETGVHEGLGSGQHTEFVLSIEWPGDAANPSVTFSVDAQGEIDELIEDNNAVVDWIKGYTLGFFFSPVALRVSQTFKQAG